MEIDILSIDLANHRRYLPIWGRSSSIQTASVPRLG
jgi:hypothetical protein